MLLLLVSARSSVAAFALALSLTYGAGSGARGHSSPGYMLRNARCRKQGLVPQTEWILQRLEHTHLPENRICLAPNSAHIQATRYCDLRPARTYQSIIISC